MKNKATIPQLIEKYWQSHDDCCLEEVEHECKTLADCVRLGKKRHHRRMTETTIRKTIKALKKSNLLNKTFCDFDELYDCVNEIIRGIKGIGQLAVYDISVRIGKRLLKPAIEPEKYVYLQSGALEGAKKLFGSSIKIKSRMPITVFPKELQEIGSYHIENFLCVMKKDL